MKRKREDRKAPSKNSTSRTTNEDVNNENEAEEFHESEDENGESSGKKAKVNRRDVYKEVAAKRAAHFARAESSTTPTGSLKKKTKENMDEEETWPGPWTTAALIIQKRDAARKVREEKIRSNENGSAVEVEELDLYDQEVARFQWTPVIRNTGERSAGPTVILSLAELCCETIARHIEDYESEQGLEYLSNEQREKVAEYLAKFRRFDPAAALKLSIPNNNSLIFPDCSQLDEDCLLKIIEKVCFPDSNINQLEASRLSITSTSSSYSSATALHRGISEVIHHSTSSLQHLSLKNCGRGFSDRVAALLVNAAHSLEVIQLEGCFRLSDDGVIKLLEGCCNSIRSLTLTSNPRLSIKGLEKISSLVHLQSLHLDYVSHLTDDQLEPLLRRKTASSSAVLPLLEISLRGLTEISPKILVNLVEVYGKQLQVLDLSACKVNDMVIIGIRNACTTLSKLILEQLDDVSNTAFMGLFIPDRYTNNDDPQITPSSSTATRGLKYISGSIGPLETVSFRGTSNVTDDVIVQLCENYSKTLQSLNLNGCNLLTMRSIAALWLKCSEEVQVLDLSFVRNISEDAIGYLVERCQRLKLLSVWGCTQLSHRFYSQIESSPRLSSQLQVIGRVRL
eukprot:gene6435-6932_t